MLKFLIFIIFILSTKNKKNKEIILISNIYLIIYSFPFDFIHSLSLSGIESIQLSIKV